MKWRVNLLFCLILLACVRPSSVHPPLTIEYSKTDLVEDSANDGSVKEKITVTSRAPWSLTTGTMTLGTHYSLSGTSIPTGLSLVVTIDANQNVTLEVSGKASAHKWDHSVKGIAFSFLKGAFLSNQVPEDNSHNVTFALFFINFPIVFYGTGENADGARTSRIVADLFCANYRPNSVPHRNIRALLSFDSTDNLSTMSSLYEIPTSSTVGSVSEILIANSWNALLTAGPLISFSSAGVVADNGRWWHGTTSDGKNSSINCDQWSSNESIHYGLASQSTETSLWLSNSVSYTCRAPLELICIAY